MWRRGMQVAMVPLYANGDLEHEDVEFGFITAVHTNHASVRFWSSVPGHIRNMGDAESINLGLLEEHNHVEQSVVRDWLPHFVTDGEQFRLTLFR